MLKKGADAMGTVKGRDAWRALAAFLFALSLLSGHASPVRAAPCGEAAAHCPGQGAPQHSAGDHKACMGAVCALCGATAAATDPVPPRLAGSGMVALRPGSDQQAVGRAFPPAHGPPRGAV